MSTTKGRDYNKMFHEIVKDLDDMPNLSIDEQWDLYSYIKHRHEHDRDRLFITDAAIAHIPDQAEDLSISIDLKRSVNKTGYENAYLHLSYMEVDNESHEEKWSSVFVMIAERRGRVLIPMGNFNFNQAILSFFQIDELLDMKDQGILPDLRDDVGGIIDTRNNTKIK